MGTMILLIFTVVAASLFYIVDETKHSKVMLSTLSATHWDEKLLIGQINNNLKNDYPSLYKVVRSLVKSDIRYDSKEILKTARPITGSGKDSINWEIKKIMEEDNIDNKRVVVWYLITCIQINSVKTKKIETDRKSVV